MSTSPFPVDAAGPLGRPTLQRMVERAQASGVTPIARVALAGSDDDEVRSTVERVVKGWTTGPLQAQLEARGVTDAALRAEVAIAVALGVTMACSSGVFPDMSAADSRRVVDLCEIAVDAVLGVGDGGRGDGPPSG